MMFANLKFEEGGDFLEPETRRSIVSAGCIACFNAKERGPELEEALCQILLPIKVFLACIFPLFLLHLLPLNALGLLSLGDMLVTETFRHASGFGAGIAARAV